MPQPRTKVDAPAKATAPGCVSGQIGLSLVEPLLDAQEAAVLLNVRVSWVRDAARERVLPCIRVGRHLRFTRTMLEDWLVEQFNDRPDIGARRGAAFSSGAPAAASARSRRAFRPRTDVALLESLSERPGRGVSGTSQQHRFS
jgi:excisionase family DNA binding protein